MATREKLQLVEDVDYYWETGLMVFTARFHLRRGYCCKSDCRHCPYKNGTMATPTKAPVDMTTREADNGS